MAYGDFKDLIRRTAPDIKYFMIKHLISLKIQNMIDVNVDFLKWSIIFLIKKYQVGQLKMKPNVIKNYQKSYTNQLLEYLKNEKRSHLLETISFFVGGGLG